MKKFTFLFFILIFISLTTIAQTTWYVSEDGDDGTGNGSSEEPWATISYALANGGVLNNDIITIEGTITEDGSVTDGIIIQKSITIRGEKFVYSTVQANDTYNTADRRVFTIYPGYDVTFEHLIIKNGKSPFNYYSGGILNYGNLTLKDCIIEDNYTADYGGGLYQQGGNLTIINCLFDGNTAENGGGGMYINNCDADIYSSTIANNSCTENLGNGGGIVINSSSSNNYIQIENCTVINNLVNYNSYGGGIYLLNQTALLITTIVNTTFTFNEGADGNSIYQEAASGSINNLVLCNCIIDSQADENYATTGAGNNNLTRTYTICRDATLPVAGAGNLNSTDPQLETYGYHGGLTPTIPIAETSPAKNAGTSTDTPELDQRGSFRIGLHDIGSFEYIPQLAGYYMINNSQPTDFPTGTNFNSFEDAINALNNGGISDFVTFFVSGGQTFEEPPLVISTTGTEDMPITFVQTPKNKNTPIVKGTGGIYSGTEPSAEADMIIALKNVSYIQFSEIIFMDNETNSTPEEKMEMGIVLFGTENIYIHECTVSLTTNESTTIGLVMVSEETSCSNNFILGNTIQNCIIGIGLFGNEDIISTDNNISENILTNIGDENSAFGAGIIGENHTDLTIEFNQINGISGNDDSYLVGISLENTDGHVLANSIEDIEGQNSVGVNLQNGTYLVDGNGIEAISSTNMTYGIMTYSSTTEMFDNDIENLSSDGMVVGISSQFSDANIHLHNNLNNFTGNSVIGINVVGVENEITIENNIFEYFVAEEYLFALNLNGDNSDFDVFSNNISELSSTTDDCMLIGIFANDNDEEIESDFSIHENKIYDLEIDASSGLVAALYNNHDGNFIAYNNLIYGLYNSNFNTTDEFSIAAIIIAKGMNSLVYNTVYIEDEPNFANNLSTILLFDGEPSTFLNMQNNIFTNNTEIESDNLAVTFINGNNNLNFLSPTTNNNLYFVGIENGSGNQLIYMDFVGNSAETLSEYQDLLADDRENVSITENPTFISTNDPVDFNINPEVETNIESGAVQISSPFSITTDIDDKLRLGEAGYNAGGTAPDIGAYEKYEPVMATTDATNITTITATLNGTVLPNELNVSDIVFEYGIETGNYIYSVIATPNTATGTEIVDILADITDLELNTTYYYRIAGNVGENEFFGQEVEFTTILDGTNDIANSNFEIYPNPTTGIFIISNLLTFAKPESVEITDIAGKVICTNEYSLISNHLEIDISNQPKGIYFVNVQTNTGVVTKKIIVQ